VASGTKSLPEIGPPQSLEADWPAATSKSLHLRMRVLRPTGFIGAEKIVDWWNPRAGGLTIEEMRREGMQVPE